MMRLDCTFEETLNQQAYSAAQTRNESLQYTNSSVAIVSTKQTHKSKALQELMQTYKSASEKELLREI